MKPSARTASRGKLPEVLAVGDLAPDCSLPDGTGNDFNFRSDSIAGHPLVIVFCPRRAADAEQVLQSVDRRMEAFGADDARVFAVTLAPIAATDLRFPVLLDRQEQAFSRFSVPRDRATIVVLRRNYHVAGILSGEADDQVAAALSLLHGMAFERQTVAMQMHPPVLLIPEALSRDDCTRLISTFTTRGQVFIEPGPSKDFVVKDFMNGADFKMRVPENGREDRIDHFFFEKETLAFLSNRLNRIMPDIAKAFHYRISQYETLRVACYQGQRGGRTHGHRDNNPPTPYRRFAMSINLNSEDFEGGELRFPEFGDQRYRPDSGTAIVFSSSLLHEAMHVTAGLRYVLLAFLF